MSSTVTLAIIEGPDYRRQEADDAGRPWEHHAFTVELRYERRTARVPWRQGLGITDDPDAERVLEAVLADCRSEWSARSFEDWASEYGYDTDSRRAEATYKAVQKQAGQIERLLGPDLYRRAMESHEDDETLARRLARGLDLDRGL